MSKKSRPGQEVPARPRSPGQSKKCQPGQEVPSRPEVLSRPRFPARPKSPSQAKKFQKAKKSNIFNPDDHDSLETIGVTRTCQVLKNWCHIFVDSRNLVRDLVDMKEEVGR